MYIVGLYMAVNERFVTVRRLAIMALPVINTIFVIVILLFGIKPFIKTCINEFKEITKMTNYEYGEGYLPEIWY